MSERAEGLDRRHLIKIGLAVPAGLIIAGCTDSGGGPPAASSPTGPTGPAGSVPAGSLPATPACTDGDEETLVQTEGPYFSKGSPERSDLRAGVSGTPLTITGFVLTTGCRPVARALLEFWQADDSGQYDNSGYRLRGHQYTGADGGYRLETIVPAIYPGRTRHIHAKAQAPNGPVLTTQLYFPGEARNGSDGLFKEALLLKDYREAAGGRVGTFTFVLRAS